jgi:hypothetical protein
VKSKVYFEIASGDTDSEYERDKFGKKYPYTEAVEDTVEEDSTTEHINVEELEKQLFDVLDQMAHRHSN